MNKQKTIVIYIWDMDIGGVQKRIKDIILYLTKHYPEFRVLLLLRTGYNTPLLKEIKKYSSVKIKVLTKTRVQKTVFGWSTLWLFCQFIIYKPDVVLTFLNRLSIQTIIVSKLIFWKKIKVVLSEEVHPFFYLKSKSFGLFWKTLTTFFYPWANLIFVQTKAIKYSLQQNFNLSLKKIKVIPNWCLLESQKSSRKFFNFLYIGRLTQEKNISLLLDLLISLKSLNKQPTLGILGNGQAKEKFIDEVNKYRLNKQVFYKSYRKDICFFIKDGEIILSPSLSESMPNVILEGYRFGLPAVVNNFPGANEVVMHGETGFIAQNKQEFIKYAKKLLGNKKLRLAMGNKASRYVKTNFGMEQLKQYVYELTHV